MIFLNNLYLNNCPSITFNWGGVIIKHTPSFPSQDFQLAFEVDKTRLRLLLFPSALSLCPVNPDDVVNVCAVTTSEDEYPNDNSVTAVCDLSNKSMVKRRKINSEQVDILTRDLPYVVECLYFDFAHISNH